jgi:hypothetical protein
VDTATLLLLGAAGGVVRAIVHAYDCMTEWLNGRQQHRLASEPPPEGPPGFGAFYDVGGESIAAVVHAVLGAVVGVLLGGSGQVSGGFMVFAAGASAPLVLVQLKDSRLTDMILGASTAPLTTGQPPDTVSNSEAAPFVRDIPLPQRSADSGTLSAAAGRAPASSPAEPSTSLPLSAADQDGTG